MGSTPTTDVKKPVLQLQTQCVLSCRVYRKSDEHYWTVELLFMTDIVRALAQLEGWAHGLSIHPNFLMVTTDAIKFTGKYGTFASYLDVIRIFLDEQTSADQD